MQAERRAVGRARVGHKAQPLLARVRRRAAGFLVVVVRRKLGLIHCGRHTADSPTSAVPPPHFLLREEACSPFAPWGSTL